VLATYLTFLKFQIFAFFTLVSGSLSGKFSLVYVNTLLPISAVIAGYFARITVVTHIHEMRVRPRMLDFLAKLLAARCSGISIFVSNAHLKHFRGPVCRNSAIVFNGVKFREDSERACWERKNRRSSALRIGLVANFAAYKGIKEYLKIAVLLEGNPEFKFYLVTNASESVVCNEFLAGRVPAGLTVMGQGGDLSKFYSSIDVIVNTSVPSLVIETFGMSLLEGMSYGCVPIAPIIGGPLDFIKHGENGFICDSSDATSFSDVLSKLAKHNGLFLEISAAARLTAEEFTVERQVSQLVQIMRL
jgi:glycosyltransferase involved in cell wall biosynthesis